MESNLDELAVNIKNWADDKGLIVSYNTIPQMLKVVEEVGETASAVARGNADGIKDGIGDSLVTLIILAYQCGLTPAECLQQAWDEIKNRQGKMKNGIFIKEEDL